MGSFLNPRNKGFAESLNSPIYVDKSPLIGILNRLINTKKKFVCVSRPRRFGKSVTAEMLVAYYARGNDSSSQFEHLKIAEDPTYAKHLNQHNVIALNMQYFYSNARHNVEDMIAELNRVLVLELAENYPDIDLSDTPLINQALLKIEDHTNEEVIFVIDEWDCILRENQQDGAGITCYLDFLRALFKDLTNISLVYMTGILPIKKYGSHSALNMFEEFSMTDPGDFAPYIGFTEDEVKGLCSEYGRDFPAMKQWYDGYAFDTCEHIYNPNSVVVAITRRKFSNYWTRTETYEALKRYIDLDMDGLRQDIVRLLAGESIKVKVRNFKNDMVNFESRNDVLTLLIHLGYLSLDLRPAAPLMSYEVMVRIPNQEIRDEFFSTIEVDHHYTAIHGLLSDTAELLSCIWDRQNDKVAEILDKAHSDDTSILNYNDENSLSCVVALAMHLSLNYYKVHRELPAGKGFADMVYLPREGVQKPALLIELKYDKSADSAIRQIHEKRYTDFFKDYRGEVLLVGINYDKTTKRHDCLIEKFVR